MVGHGDIYWEYIFRNCIHLLTQSPLEEGSYITRNPGYFLLILEAPNVINLEKSTYLKFGFVSYMAS